MSLTIKTPNAKTVIINTGLSEYSIIAYTEKICKLKGWSYCMPNVVRAKQILDAMSVIEHQHKLFLPIDFDTIYEKLKTSTQYN